jgi:hypothetical protein
MTISADSAFFLKFFASTVENNLYKLYIGINYNKKAFDSTKIITKLCGLRKCGHNKNSGKTSIFLQNRLLYQFGYTDFNKL